jgi:hypothetical protein
MTKPALISKKPRKQHTPEFRNEALKLQSVPVLPPLPENSACMNHSFMPGAAS